MLFRSLAEIEDYCKERNSSVDPKRFYDFYSTPDPTRGNKTWLDTNGKEVRNWKQKVITWEGRDNSPKNKTDRFEAPTEAEREADMDLLRRMTADMERRSNAES